MTHDIGDGPGWEEDYKFTHDPPPIGDRNHDYHWQYKLTSGDVEDCGSCKTEQDAMDEAYEHWLEQRE